MSFPHGDEDPTDFEGISPLPGILPVQPADSTRNPRTNAATAASAAGVRAFTAQAIAFYFRAPVKAFFRTRVDYLAYARNIQQQSQSTQGPISRRLAWIQSTTPGVLAAAIRHYGWRVIPEQILPPLVANVTVGAVLYTTYLHILGNLHHESSKATKRVYPPPAPVDTLMAGTMAGAIQSVIAAPLDAIQVRYERSHATSTSNGNGVPQSMWTFGRNKLREIGAGGIFAGWGLSFLKDSLGSGVFFCSFEYVKAQGYYNFARWYYGALKEDVVDNLARKRPHESSRHSHQDELIQTRTIKPHYAMEPAFLMLAGVSASVAQQLVLYPLSHVQIEHWQHLEELDKQAASLRHKPKRWKMFRAYYHAYQETWTQCLQESQGIGMRRWLYRGFWWNTIRQVPSTSAGLIIFELVRRKYGFGNDEIRINFEGYDILLN